MPKSSTLAATGPSPRPPLTVASAGPHHRSHHRTTVLALLLGLLGCSSWAQTPVTGTASQPDANGAYTITLDIEQHMPVWVGAKSYSELHFRYLLPPNHTIRRIRTFYAVGRGHIFEGHLLITANDYMLVARGPHKERTESFDAWQTDAANYTSGDGVTYLDVFALCAPTFGRKVQFHVGAVIEVVPAATTE